MRPTAAKVTQVTGSELLFIGLKNTQDTAGQTLNGLLGETRPGGIFNRESTAEFAARYWFFNRAASNSSPVFHSTRLGALAASHPRANPNRATAESPVKSISGWYSSLGW
jgi:hypothetical protein